MQKHNIKLNTGKSLTAISPIKDCQELAEALFKDKLFVVVECCGSKLLDNKAIDKAKKTNSC